jgi:hypothetical protein
VVAVLIAAVLASAASAYAIGYAFVADTDSFLRTKFGVLLLIGVGLSFLILPPQLVSVGSSLPSMGVTADSGLMSSLAWPSGLSRGLYMASWIVLTIGGLLAGLRIWNVRDPEWRRSSAVLDASSASRAEGLLPLANSLQEALEVLGRAQLKPKDAERLAPQLQTVGRRFGHQLPEKNSEAFNLIMRYVPPSVAPIVTGHILKGAVRIEPTTREES